MTLHAQHMYQAELYFYRSSIMQTVVTGRHISRASYLPRSNVDTTLKRIASTITHVESNFPFPSRVDFIDASLSQQIWSSFNLPVHALYVTYIMSMQCTTCWGAETTYFVYPVNLTLPNFMLTYSSHSKTGIRPCRSVVWIDLG